MSEGGTEGGAGPASPTPAVSPALFDITVVPPAPAKPFTLSVALTDQVANLRHQLSEALETCCESSYCLLLDDGTSINSFVPLSAYGDALGETLTVKRRPYDSHSARTHVRRVQEVLVSPPLQPKLQPMVGGPGGDAHPPKPLSTAAVEALAADFPVADLEAPVCVPRLVRAPAADASRPAPAASSGPQWPPCVKSITASGWNPPPPHRRLQGDLFYLEVRLLEGTAVHVTATPTGFFLNKTRNESWSPAPATPSHHTYSLVDLLAAVSPKFKRGWATLMAAAREASATKTAFSTVPNPYPAYLLQAFDGRPVTDSITPSGLIGGHAHCALPWLVPASPQLHTYDATRAEVHLSDKWGVMDTAFVRDWMEEYSSYVSMPSSTPAERLERARLLSRVRSDFTDAAVAAVTAILDGHIPPLNPSEPEASYVYVYNNVFVTRSPQRRQLPGDPLPARESAFPELGAAPGARAHADIASVTPNNHALHAVKEVNALNIAGLHTLLNCHVDLGGSRHVAQCLIPGILQGEKVTTLVYGTTDNGATVAADPDFHGKVGQLFKALHVGPRVVTPAPVDAAAGRPPVDNVGPASLASTEAVELWGPPECKGIIGAGRRSYVLDLCRITPRDANYYDAHPTPPGGSPAYVAQLRLELVRAWAQTLDPSTPFHGLNVNLFTPFEPLVTPKDDDKAVLRSVAAFLLDRLPSLHDSLAAAVPHDGAALTSRMHAHGINMRYLGRVAGLASAAERGADGAVSPVLLNLLETEMVARTAAHMVWEHTYTRPELLATFAAFGAGFLSALLGAPGGATTAAAPPPPPTKSKKRRGKKAAGGHKAGSASAAAPSGIDGVLDVTAAALGGLDLSHDTVWTEVHRRVAAKYGYELQVLANGGHGGDAWRLQRANDHRVALLRRVAQRTGVQLAARDYNFSVASPFAPGDIVGVVPRVAHDLPDVPVPDAMEVLTRAQSQLAAGQLQSAFEAGAEALVLLYNVVGTYHVANADCHNLLASVLWAANDRPAAIVQQQRAVAILDRMRTPCDPEAALAHGRLAAYLHGVGDVSGALLHNKWAHSVLAAVSGPHHKDTIAALIKQGLLFQDVSHASASVSCFKAALELCGNHDTLQAATCLHGIATSCGMSGAFSAAYQHEKESYQKLKAALGTDAQRTKDSEEWLRKFAEKTVAAAEAGAGGKK